MPTSPELIDYIQKARSSGATDDAIRQGLLSAGWNTSDVDNALNPISTAVPIPTNIQSQNPVTPLVTNTIVTKSFSPFLTISLAVLGALIISVIALYILIGKDGVSDMLFPQAPLPETQIVNTAKQELERVTTAKPEVVASTTNTAASNLSNKTQLPAATQQQKTASTKLNSQVQTADCNSITDPTKQIGCFVNEALEKGNSTFCVQLKDPDTRSGCYMAAAAVQNSYPECNKVASEDKVLCILVVAAENGDSTTCSKFKGPDNLGEICHYYVQHPAENIMIDLAYLGRGIDTKNKSDCAKITYSVLQNQCYSAIQ